MSGPTALHAFRALLKQIRITFKRDDFAIRLMSKEVRSQFEANRGLTDQGTIQRHLAEAEEARLCIKENVVQAEKTSCGTYAVRPEDAQRLQQMAPPDTKAPSQ